MLQKELLHAALFAPGTEFSLVFPTKIWYYNQITKRFDKERKHDEHAENNMGWL